MSQTSEVDRERLEGFLKLVGSQVAAGFNCSLSALGDRLGLYRALADIGPVNSDELATHTGLHERWLREWLRHQACVGQVEYAEGRFGLSPEAKIVLAEEGHAFFFASGFGAVTATYPSLPRLPDAFRTGLGLTYDDHGAACACGIERMNAHLQRRELVPKLLPEIDGIVGKMPEPHRRFLLSFKRGEPDWALLDVPHARTLPAVRWKMENLARMDTQRRAELTARLETVLTGQADGGTPMTNGNEKE